MKSLLRGEARPERALVALVPHTTSLRNSRFEVPLAVQFLRPCAFDVQRLVTIAHAKACDVASHDGATRAAHSGA
jgi:mRNA-degrading endonuclease toxin of MazEF toxin-antitoxin module